MIFFIRFYFSLRLLLKKPIERLSDFEHKFYSQNGEDGILYCIFKKIGLINSFCVELGIGKNISEFNSLYFIKKQNWRHVLIDYCSENKKGKPFVFNEFITPENVNILFSKFKIPESFDLLSIDIDYNTYWVWDALGDEYKPNVVVIEYNSCIPFDKSMIVEKDSKAVWDGTDYFGASLMAFQELGKRKGYMLVGCDSRGINAFFVRKELCHFFLPQSIENLYKPPQYYHWRKGNIIYGHPKNLNRKWVV